MRLLFLNHNQERFGTYYRCWHLGRHLAHRGHQVTLICASGREFDLRVRRREVEPNFTLVTQPRVKYSRFFTGQGLRLVIGCLQIVRYGYDLLHAFTVAQPQIGVPAWLAQRWLRRPLVVDWDDLWGGGFANYHPWPVRRTLEVFEARIPRLAKRVTLVSHYLADRAKQVGLEPHRIRWVPNGADVDEVKPLEVGECRRELGIPAGVRVVVSVGNTYMNCLNTLWEAFRLVRQEEPAVRLFMVGLVDVPRDSQKLFGQVRDGLVLTGPKPLSQVVYYLGAADVLVLPMSADPIEQARFPIRLGDYLASGRPIVSNATGEVKRVLTTYACGLTSAPDDSAGFAQNILEVLRRRDLAQDLGQRARSVAEGELSWSRIAEGLEKVYQEVVTA